MARQQLQEKHKAVRKSVSVEPAPNAVEYIGKRTKTGNSMGFRFESALFRSHPEFSGTVRARVLGPGRLLVEADLPRAETAEEDDPVLGPFLALIARDMLENPQKIKPLDETLMKEISALTVGIEVDPDEDLGDESLLA